MKLVILFTVLGLLGLVGEGMFFKFNLKIKNIGAMDLLLEEPKPSLWIKRAIGFGLFIGGFSIGIVGFIIILS